MYDDFVVVETRLMRDGFAGVFGGAGELEGLGAVEGRCEADFAGFFRVYLGGGLLVGESWL